MLLKYAKIVYSLAVVAFIANSFAVMLLAKTPEDFKTARCNLYAAGGVKDCIMQNWGGCEHYYVQGVYIGECTLNSAYYACKSSVDSERSNCLSSPPAVPEVDMCAEVQSYWSACGAIGVASGEAVAAQDWDVADTLLDAYGECEARALAAGQACQ